MEAPGTFVLGIVGGASGVGKTTLLDAISSLGRVNTGDLFKQRMAVGSRDDIRSTDWSKYEEDVTDDLIAATTQKLRGEPGLLIDTHFAAKLNGAEYRIGLSRQCLYRLARATLTAAADRNVVVKTRIVLIHSSPYDLLARRRKDLSRKRELVPGDCVRALSRNNTCSSHYHFEFSRAYKAEGFSGRELIEKSHIENDNLDRSLELMRVAFEGVAA